MKRKHAKNISRLMALAMMLIMTVSMLPGCGKDTGGNSGSANQEASFIINEADSGDVRRLDEENFSITLGHSYAWDYETISYDGNDGIVIFNPATRAASPLDDEGYPLYDGNIMTVFAFSKGDTSYEDHPHYTELGEDDEYTYVAEFPTDVRFDPENQEAMEEYRSVFREVIYDSGWFCLAEDDTADFGTAKNLSVRTDGDMKTISTDDYELTLSHGDTWDYAYCGNGALDIFNVNARDNGEQGTLAYLVITDDEGVAEEAVIIGETDGGYVVAEFPDDFWCDDENMADYMAVHDEIESLDE